MIKEKCHLKVFFLGCRPYVIPVFLFFSALFISCENDEKEVETVLSSRLGKEETRDVEITYTVGGKTRSILKAPVMLRIQDTVPFVEFPKSIKADFYNEEGVVESFLSAGYGRYRENQGVIFIRDSVIVINRFKGDTLYCRELYWDRHRTGREFYTQKPVRIRTPTQVIDGVGMESDQDFRDWQILQPSGTVEVPASRFPE